MNGLIGERRRFERTAKPVCAWLSFGGDEVTCGTLTMDLSLSGARLSTLRHVRTGDVVSVRIQLPSSCIECSAEVRWSDLASNGLRYFGVAFVGLNDLAQRHLTRFLRRALGLAEAANR